MMNILIAGDVSGDRDGKVAKALDGLLAGTIAPILHMEAGSPMDRLCALYGCLRGIATVAVPFDPEHGLRSLIERCDKAVLFHRGMDRKSSRRLRFVWLYCTHIGLDTRVIGRELDDNGPVADLPQAGECDNPRPSATVTSEPCAPTPERAEDARTAVFEPSDRLAHRPFATGRPSPGRGQDGLSGHHDVGYVSHGERCEMTLGHRGEKLTRAQVLSYVAARWPLWTGVRVT